MKKCAAPFASFFRGDNDLALVSQVEWLQKELGVSDQFFSNLLNIDQELFSSWRSGDTALSEDAKHHLKEFWKTMLHILSFLNFDLELVRAMLEHKDESRAGSIQLPFDPPWIGTSIKAYLATKGPLSIQKVDKWVQTIRFADPY